MGIQGSPVRNAGEDAVRVLGLLAVVVGHVWYVEPVIRWTYSWHVPLFFVLGGYHWVAARSLREEVRVRYRGIGRPYVFWWVVVCLVYAIWERFWGLGYVPVKFIALAAWGGLGALRPWTAFWFFSAFFIAMVVVRWSSRAGWWWTLAFAYVALVFAYVEPERAMRAPLASVSAVACMGFVLLGMGLRQARPRLRRPALVGLVALVAGAGGVCLPGYRPLGIKSADFGSPILGIVVASLIASGLVLVGTAAATRIPSTIGRAISTVAQCAVPVFLSHGIFLLILRTPNDGGWLDFAVVLGVPLAFALVTRRSRWARWTHGISGLSYRGGSHKQFPGAMLQPDAGP